MAKIKCDTCGQEFYADEIISFTSVAGVTKVEHICFACEIKEEEAREYINFGDVARGKLGLQCQYASRYVHGLLEDWPNLGKGLRFKGDAINNYHSLLIHKDDVDEFVKRVQEFWKERERRI